MKEVKRIAFATDFSEASALAFNMTKLLREKLSADVVILHTVQTRSFGVPPQDPHVDEERNRMDFLAQALGGNCEEVLLDGDAGPAIIRYVNDHPIDMLIMGSHHYTGIHRLLHPSIADEAAHKVRCPVLRC